MSKIIAVALIAAQTIVERRMLRSYKSNKRNAYRNIAHACNTIGLCAGFSYRPAEQEFTHVLRLPMEFGLLQQVYEALTQT